MDGLEVKASVGSNLGLPFTDVFQGKEIKVRLLDQEVQAILEDKLISKRRQMLLKDKLLLSDSEFGAIYSAFSNEVLTSQFAFGGELMGKWLKTFQGMGAVLEQCTGIQAPWEFILKDPTNSDHLAATTILSRIWADSFPN